MLRFLTAGESHGQALVAIVEGVPAGLPLRPEMIQADLARRQLGYGRGRRMTIEQDRAEFLSGVRRGETLGSPIALLIHNRDWAQWQHTMSVEEVPSEDLPGARRGAVTRPRPGHADLSGGLKYGRTDLRDVLERASARETAARVAVGAVARALLARYGILIASHVFEIGGAAVTNVSSITFDAVSALAPSDEVHCVDTAVADRMRQAVDAARQAGDTVGGAFEIIAHRVPPGLGSHVQWDRKLDGRLAQALMSIPAIKAVGIGLGSDVGHLSGSWVHDEILPATESPSGTVPGIVRPTNRAGGLEGGVTNGEDVRVSAWMKPIATLMKPLRSVDLASMTESPATVERSDVCAVPAAAVVGEAMMAIVLADALIEKFGADSVTEIDDAYRRYTDGLASRLTAGRQG
jgi:chorismate synthase